MPPKKQRPNNFFEVGVQGRKTGITLADTGIRDEYGLEPIEGIFSSPTKSSPRRQLDLQDATISASEDMDVQQSSAPELLEAISVQKLARNSRTMLPPPRGKSPVKTHIGSSPRRQSMAPPVRTQSAEPAPVSSSPQSVNRRLDFSVKQAHRSASEVTPDRVNKAAARTATKNGVDIYDLTPSPGRGQKRTFEESFVDEVEQVNGDVMLELAEETLDPLEDADLPVTEIEDESMQLLAEEEEDSEEDGVEEEGEEEGEEGEESEDVSEAVEGEAEEGGVEEQVLSQQHEESETVESPPQKRAYRKKSSEASGAQQKKRGRPAKLLKGDEQKKASKNSAKAAKNEKATKVTKTVGARGSRRLSSKAIEAEVSEVSGISEVLVETGEPASKKRRGRPPRSEAPAAKSNKASPDEDVSKVSVDASALGTKKRGRPAKAKTEVAQSRSSPAEAEDEAGKPSSSSKEMLPPPLPPSRGRKPKGTEDDKVYKGPIDAALGPSAIRGGSVPRAEAGEATKSNVLLRSQTPFDETFKRSQYGRTIIPPISYYLGERLEYGTDGSLQNIVKAEIAQQRIGARGKGRKSTGRSYKRKAAIVEEEAEEEREEWEREEPGVLSGYVQGWDEEVAKESGEMDEMELAMAYRAIQPREVANGDFSYARIFGGFPWFSNGIVKLPPSGVKRPKPSRKMHLVFFVIRGQVEVTVGTNVFKISRGGAFQVPRGNTYGIDNASDKVEAELFFTQASQPSVENDG